MSGNGTRFSDLVKLYDGEGDFSEWLKKLELVCKLQKVKELQSVLPLFLSGGAFAVYDGLTDAVKSDYSALTQALQQAFSANCFQAYEEFISRRLLPGESVDVYASDLKRLAKLIDSSVSDEWIKSSFVHGLPREVQNQLKAACCLQDMELSKVLERARSLVNGSESNVGAAAQMEVSVLLGMDAISAMGGVTIQGDGGVEFKKGLCTGAVAESEQKGDGDQKIIREIESKQEINIEKKSAEKIIIEDCDFKAEFLDGKWTVEWNWKDVNRLPMLENQVKMYRIPENATEAFETEVEEWIKSGWLQPYHGEFEGVIPLMAVIQQNKDKVRPVMDYRELNQFVSSHTAGSEVCSEKLRLWRRLGEHVSTVDLRKAYLQIHIAPHLWKFQVVKFKGENYCLTRLGFVLNVAPKIMGSIVNKVLSMDPIVRSATDSYVDDIVVNEEIVSSDVVIRLLETYGLTAKPAETLDGGRVLGLRLRRAGCKLMWYRDNKLKPLDQVKTKKDVFSLCGQLIGHYPVASWLRPACSFVKRHLSDLKWDDLISERAQTMLTNIMDRIDERDPATGKWAVSPGEEGKVWCDASSLAIGVCLEIEGEIVEDASWLRKQHDSAHINLAELEAILKGVNLALRWGLKKIVFITDSATVHAWVSSILTGDRPIKTHGLSEVLPPNPSCTSRWKEGVVTGQFSPRSVEVNGRPHHIADVRKVVESKNESVSCVGTSRACGGVDTTGACSCELASAD
ncbi:uncharacterized protein LOC128989196 [Macrosteles quadrilineatus]|uniref:uncharacterized protein LOC128989196 n=1 Tax=Macrosteles quadrilineatus TaxID=74068 RepID=UPI0023E25D3A|nr:uncharacterized protein LOC128989196 [Macrosteles quadrilineatus]